MRGRAREGKAAQKEMAGNRAKQRPIGENHGRMVI